MKMSQFFFQLSINLRPLTRKRHGGEKKDFYNKFLNRGLILNYLDCFYHVCKVNNGI